jgi:hypothetical protein
VTRKEERRGREKLFKPDGKEIAVVEWVESHGNNKWLVRFFGPVLFVTIYVVF